MIDQRKTVSVVFADLVESTSLAERHDPEVLAGLLGRYFATLRAVVEKHGGTVEKFIGDAVVGVFGVPTLHEDDALRAVRAAIEMQGAIAALNAELDASLESQLRIRVGVNTGEVVVSADNALGHAISMAARLEQNASAGEILIGRETFALVATAVDTEETEPLTVKGSSEPISAWRATGLREVAPRGSRAGGTYVGRQRELQQVVAAFESAVSQPACVTVTVVGPPGLGKSRLISEGAARIAEKSRVLQGWCLPYGEGITYAPLIDIVRHLEAEEGADALDRLMAAESDVEQVVARVRSTTGGAASGSPDEIAWAFRRLFDTLATVKPLVVLIDDIHWADPLLLDLIEYVGTFSVGRPILLLCGARPDLFDTRPGWAAPRENAQQLRLAPLTDEETNSLLFDVVGHLLDEEARRRIVETSGGVPLFVEQMAAFGVDANDATQVPPTIRALLAARVDRLPADERGVLERAAIQGPVFRRDTLAQLMPDEARGALGSQLMALIRREFIRPERQSSGYDAFGFNHALIRDAVYEAMPRHARAEMHERYADILAGQAETPDELVGHHLEQAQRERVALGETGAPVIELCRRAGLSLAAAGRTATARKESVRAVDLLVRASNLLAVDQPVRLTVLPDLIDAHISATDTESAAAVRLEAIELARDAGDVTSELRAELAWAVTDPTRDATGWQDRTLGVIERSLDHFSREGDDASIARVLLLKGLALSARDLPGAIDAFKQAQVHASKTNDERIQVEVWDELGGAMLFGPTPYPDLLEFMRREIEWARERGIAFSVADGRLGEAYSLAALGEFESALALLEELIAFFATLPGRVAQHGECYTLAGRIERDRSNPEAAISLYRRAMDAFDESGHRRWWRNAAPGVVHAALDLGRVAEAKSVLELMAARDVDNPNAPGAFRLEAEARYRAEVGNVAGGIELALRAVAAAADTGALFYEGRARETLAGLLALADDEAGARRELALARSLYERKGYLPGIQRVNRAQTAP